MGLRLQVPARMPTGRKARGWGQLLVSEVPVGALRLAPKRNGGLAGGWMEGHRDM